LPGDMDQPSSSQPRVSSSTPENPLKAIGRRVKSAVSGTSHQQPSVRIQRGPPSNRQQQQLPILENDAEKGSGGGSKNGFWSLFSRKQTHSGSGSQHEYDSDTVDLMDVVDPEVATLATLNNVQNSLFVPSLGKWVNRRPMYRIQDNTSEARTIDKVKASLRRISNPVEERDERPRDARLSLDKPLPSLPRKPLPSRTKKPTPAPNNFQYAILPDDEYLEGWTPANTEELDDHVRHMLHSRRAKFKRSMKGFTQYVRRPLGLFITVYATLVTLFGAAWVFFLIGWISLGSKHDYIINIVDNVLVALFAIIGDGLAPFRAVDTYHMAYIVHYHRKTLKVRNKMGLPQLVDQNDLPDKRKTDDAPCELDLESLVARKVSSRRIARGISSVTPKSFARRIVSRSKNKEPTATCEFTVLTEEEQAKLEYHQRKFSKSHTFYKPHETETHYAFPLRLLIAVVVLLDCHSALQITLGACTWGISYKTRPFALTTVILCFSITCNIMGGVLISRGDKQTRKKDVIERMMRQELTSEAIEDMRKRWLKEAEERGDIDKAVRKRLEEEKEQAENEEIKKSWKTVPSLPKTLLGKGEDHRQPALPQEARRSSSNIPSPASTTPSTPKNSKSRSAVALPSLREDLGQPSQPKPAVMPKNEPPKEATGQKIMKFIRRADMDRS